MTFFLYYRPICIGSQLLEVLFSILLFHWPIVPFVFHVRCQVHTGSWKHKCLELISTYSALLHQSLLSYQSKNLYIISSSPLAFICDATCSACIMYNALITQVYLSCREAFLSSSRIVGKYMQSGLVMPSLFSF